MSELIIVLKTHIPQPTCLIEYPLPSILDKTIDGVTINKDYFKDKVSILLWNNMALRILFIRMIFIQKHNLFGIKSKFISTFNFFGIQSKNIATFSELIAD